MRLELLLKQPKALPTVPALALKLIATFEQDDPDLRLMAMDVASDPVLTAKLLKQANSAFFGLSRALELVGAKHGGFAAGSGTSRPANSTTQSSSGGLQSRKRPGTVEAIVKMAYDCRSHGRHVARGNKQ